MGYISAIQTKNEQIMCALGYSNHISGLCAALVFIGGVAGSFILGYMFTCVKQSVLCSKIICLPLVAIMAAQIFLLKMSDVELLIGLMYALFGFFSIGY